MATIWDLNNGVKALRDGTLMATKIGNGSDDTEIAINGNTNTLSTGSDTTSIFGGYVIMNALPTADPSSAGQLWNDNGTVMVSAGG